MGASASIPTDGRDRHAASPRLHRGSAVATTKLGSSQKRKIKHAKETGDVQRLLLADLGRSFQHSMLPNWKIHGLSRGAGPDPLQTYSDYCHHCGKRFCCHQGSA